METTANRSYGSRHWRGELPLARSYWINGVLIFGVASNFVVAAAAAATVAAFRRQPEIGVPIILVLLILQLAIYVWALVGTWRSAGRYCGPRVWAILARIGMCLGVLISLANIAQTLQNIDTQFQGS